MIAEFCAESHLVCMPNANTRVFQYLCCFKSLVTHLRFKFSWQYRCYVWPLAALLTSLRTISSAKGAATHGQLMLSCRLEAGPIRIAQDMGPTVLSIKRETHNSRLLLPPIVTLRLVIVVSISPYSWLQLSSRVYSEIWYFVWIRTNLLSEVQQRSL